jgi:hypothetical protein
MTTLTELLNTTSAQTLGWVLLHSLWQGALVALGLVLVSFLQLGLYPDELRDA